MCGFDFEINYSGVMKTKFRFEFKLAQLTKDFRSLLKFSALNFKRHISQKGRSGSITMIAKFLNKYTFSFFSFFSGYFFYREYKTFSVYDGKYDTV